MKITNETISHTVLNKFDKELKAILLHDLKQFRKSQGQFLRNTSSSKQVPDQNLMVA
ncbi:hypothetical protein [Hufsiella ginkgonis]|uniref:Uncharacterized protein n=1 Tax=Hufsiella ginkgonis TaxID=2695274 RepID=A0A7K1Y3Y0_9SPHI|nr:hypothetical protein [Hufsiella ginkgonis]MXV17577.1 hypothetical protein [Hufsiella ginkgonis]